MKNWTIQVPKTLNDIKLRDYIKWAKILESNKEVENNFLEIKILETFCNMTAKEVQELPVGAADTAIQHLVNLLNEEPPLTERFKMTGSDGVELEFGFIPNLSKMTMGEYVDLDTYISQPSEMHRTMSILYRVIDKSWGNNRAYRINEYQGTDHLSGIMLDMPTGIALGALVFFYHLETKLLTRTMLSTAKQYLPEQGIPSAEQRKPFLNAMDGIKAYMLLREEKRLKSKLRLNSLSTKQ